MPSQAIAQEYSKEVGAILRAAREQRALQPSEIAVKIALSPSQLRLIEQGETESFYNHHFYLQAIRRYSEFLGVALPSPSAHEPDSSPAEIFEDLSLDDAVPRAEPVREASRKTTVSLIVIAVGVLVAGLAMLQSEKPGVPPLVTMAPPATLAPPPAPAVTVAPSTAAVPAPAPAATPAPAVTPTPIATPTPAAPSAPPPALAEKADAPENASSTIVNTGPTWIQIVGKDGSKQNLRPQPGEVIRFNAQSTAALAFGRPSTARLTVNGQEVDIEKFLVEDASSPRALVVLRDL